MKYRSLEVGFSGRWRTRVGMALTALVFGAACVSTTPPEGANDPSSARAASAPAPEASPVLEAGHAPLPEAASVEGEHPAHTPASHDHASHDHASHDHASHGDGTHEHATSGGAADERAPRDGKKSAPMYVCPMHPEVRQAEPGRCPKCGMALELEASTGETKE